MTTFTVSFKLPYGQEYGYMGTQPAETTRIIRTFISEEKAKAWERELLGAAGILGMRIEKYITRSKTEVE